MLTQRMLERLAWIKMTNPDNIDNPDFRIPVKITPGTIPEAGLEIRMNKKGIKSRIFEAQKSGIEKLTLELEARNIPSIPPLKIGSETYFYAQLNINDLIYLKDKPYVREIDDDTPVM